MKTVGVVAEYNPFHNGHLYHIEKAKEITGADRIVAVMSGDYVQRGAPAVMSKYLRAKAALKCGVCAVFELPVCWSIGSAELFAAGAVSLLDKLGIVDCLCFGSECGDIKILKEAANFLSDEPQGYKDALRGGLKEGLSFPRARQAALEHMLKSPAICAAVQKPNNILAIEYLKALKRLGSDIVPFCVKREGSGYNEPALNSGYSSAGAIRSFIGSFEKGNGSCPSTPDALFNGLQGKVPQESLEILKEYYRISYPISENDFSLLLKSRLLGKSPEKLFLYADVSRELADKIFKGLESFMDYTQFAASLKSKETTLSRINRALLHICLNIKKDDVNRYINDGYHYYIRLLGVRKDSEDILGEIAAKSFLPLIVSLNRTEGIPKSGVEMLGNDILCSDLYNSVVTEKYKAAFHGENRRAALKV